MSKALANEAGTVQFPLLDHAKDVGWAVVSETDALTKRRGEAGLFFSRELGDALLRLNPGIVRLDSVNGIIQRMESVPNTIEGNREILEWLRGNTSAYDESERRHRNITLIDYANLNQNVFQVAAFEGPQPRKASQESAFHLPPRLAADSLTYEARVAALAQGVPFRGRSQRGRLDACRTRPRRSYSSFRPRVPATRSCPWVSRPCLQEPMRFAIILQYEKRKEAR